MKRCLRLMIVPAALVLLGLSVPAVAKQKEQTKGPKAEAKRQSFVKYKEAYEEGNRALEEKRWDAAVDAYDQAARLATQQESQSKATNAKGWVLLKIRRLSDSRDAFRKATELDHKNILALGNLAYASFTMYQSGLAGVEALQTAQEAMETYQKMDGSYKTELSEQIKAALGRLDAYAKAAPIVETPAMGMGYKKAAALGDQAQAQGQFELALKAYDVAEKDANSSVAKGSAANRAGMALLDARRPKEAIDQFRRAVKYQPKEKVFLNNLGYAHWLLYDSGQAGKDDLMKAVELFDQVNQIDPSYRADNLKMAIDELREADLEAAKAYAKDEEYGETGDKSE